MNRAICVKGHFYDGDKYDACPHCAVGVPAVAQSAFAVKYGENTAETKSERESGKKEAEKEKKEKKGLFGRKNSQAVKQEAVKAESDETLLLHDTVTGSAVSQPVISQSIASQSIVAQPVASLQPAVSQSRVTGPSFSQSHATSFTQNQSLGAAFAAVAGNSEARDEGKTVGYFSTGANLNPPVGYLICIAGEDFGMGFPLKSGSNSMGRSASMDIVVMDEKVSREKQAFVIYEPLKREFYLKPGEGSALCYLNGDVVLDVMKLKQHDIVMLGSTKLMLIKVCSEAFSWDDIVN